MSCAKRSFGLFLPVLLASIAMIAFAPSAVRADIVFSGDNDPVAPANWNSSTDGYIGNDDIGTANVDSASILYSQNGYVGYTINGDGTATVDGSGSMWVSSGSLSVGYGGFGTLNIINGGAVTNTDGIIGVVNTFGSGTVMVDGTGSTWTNTSTLYLGYLGYGTLVIANGGAVTVGDLTHVSPTSVGDTHSNGLISFEGSGGTLTTKSLYAETTDLIGTGTIDARGIRIGADLTFDSGSSTSFTLTGTNQNITVNLDLSDSNDVGDLGVGYLTAGTYSLSVTNGSTINSVNGYLGHYSDVTSTATVDGTNSTWNNSGDLRVGYVGDGTLNITNGGAVDVAGITYVGSSISGLTQTVAFGADGGTLTTKGLYVAPTNLTGTGTISANGIVTDADLVFDSSPIQTSTLNQSGQHITLNLDMSDSNNVGDLGVGYQGSGSLTIRNEAAVNSVNGYLGLYEGSAGTAVVDGDNSKWTIDGTLYVGAGGRGTLNITNGGCVSNDKAQISVNGSAATLNGSGSTWTCSGDLQIAAGGTSSSTLLVAGGVLNVGRRLSLVGSGGTFTQTGGTVNIAAFNGQSGFDFTGGATSAVNIQGGVFNVNSNPSQTVDPASPINFSGGVWLNQASAIMGPPLTFNLQSGGSGAIFQQDAGLTGLVNGAINGSGGFTKTGAGTLILSANMGPNMYSGTTIIQEGSLVLDGSTAQMAMLNMGRVADIQGGKLVFGYMGSSPVSSVQTMLQTSYTGGTASWTTGQLRSTTSDGSHGLGWIDNGTDSVTVMYTLYGDSNLDGSVNGSDLNAVLSYYNKSGEIWNHGDFNYDGSVNGSDLNTVLSNYNRSLSASTAAVPEPSTLLLLILGLAGLLAAHRVRAYTHR